VEKYSINSNGDMNKSRQSTPFVISTIDRIMVNCLQQARWQSETLCADPLGKVEILQQLFAN